MVKRKEYLDVLKILAVFLVYFNHTGIKGYSYFTLCDYGVEWYFFCFISIFSKIAVPLFFMVTGALLLGRDESYLQLLKKRVLKTVIVIIVASAILQCYMNICSGSSFDVKDFFLKVYKDEISGTYWYLYSYLGILLMLPLLRKLANSMEDKDFKYLILLYFVMRIIRFAQFAIGKGMVQYSSSLFVFGIEESVFFPLCGYYLNSITFLSDCKNCSKVKTSFVLIGISIVTILVSCYFTKVRCIWIGECKEASCQLFFSVLAVVPAVSIFFLSKMYITNFEGLYSQFIVKACASSSLYLYVFEKIIKDTTIWIYDLLVEKIGGAVSLIIWLSLAIILSSFAIYTVKYVLRYITIFFYKLIKS